VLSTSLLLVEVVLLLAEEELVDLELGQDFQLRLELLIRLR
jgi:hypothetical protein